MLNDDLDDGVATVYADRQNIKVAVTMRAARAALGVSQQELADSLGISKSTIARIETLEMQPKVDVYVRALSFFKKAGIEIDPALTDDIVIRISPKSLDASKSFLDDETKRRSDRRALRSVPENKS